MLIMGSPQFNTQDDSGIGDGIPPIPEWQLDPTGSHELPELIKDVDHEVSNVFIRLRNVFQRTANMKIPNTQLHDLTSFVIHRLLLPPGPSKAKAPSSPASECIRCAIILYMLAIQGPTYYSHAIILNTIVIDLMENLNRLDATPRVYCSLDIWLIAIGMVASTGTAHYRSFLERASNIATSLQLIDAEDVLNRIKSILWLETIHAERTFRPHWEAIMTNEARPLPLEHTCTSSGCPGPGLL